MKEVVTPRAGLLDRIRAIGQAGLFAVTGQWEGTERDRLRNRPAFARGSQDQNLNLGVRGDFVSEARNLAQNVGIVPRILRQYRNYVVGEMKVKWSTADDKLNKQAETQFRSWSRVCDRRGMHSFRSMTGVALISYKRDGDFFINAYEDGPLLQLEGIEGDRVRNIKGKTGLIDIDEEKIVGGVKIGPNDEPTAYIVCDRVRTGGIEVDLFANPRPLDRINVMHLWDTMRYDAYRGITAFHPVINALRDLKETVQDERTAQKIASRLALLVKSQRPPSSTNPGINLKKEENKLGSEINVEEISTGVIKYMFPGEDIQAFMSSRPSEGWFNLTMLFIREISVALDLPFEFVWNMAGLQGTATRLVSKQAERTFELEQILLEERIIIPTITRWLAKEMREGRLPQNEELLENFHVLWPAHPSVDAGYDSKGGIAEVEAGQRTEDSWAAERGEDGETNRIESKRIAKHRLTLAFEAKEELESELGEEIPLDTILGLMGRPNAKLGASEAPKEEEEPEKEEKIAA